ncbi:uncharacterized protein LOC130809391 [Amaranthus tricolor]|uniref:uncharacterized protein LOC130809391 n=1 Tax=Amaranthus tricolor TaxID=29722 RepID=UPI00258B9212|nr:uncharacterized protein LOC130809391 [Amaranthus tricolor]XP_057531142.1 uncharacterized protein LOC130809391 [Amaranthus tricolor]
MSTAQAFSDNSLPKNLFDNRNLRGCTTRKKRDNIVLIDVDSELFGDVFILDVPESFQKKFRKNPKHAICIDDYDVGSGGSSCGERVDGASRTNINAMTSDECSPPEAAEPSTSAFVDVGGLFCNEGNMPVKLSKSKRAYSGQSASRSQYGHKPDSEGGCSESDCSDCELMVGSPEKLREEWKKAFHRRRKYAGFPEPSHPVHDNANEGSDGERVDGAFHTNSDTLPSERCSSPEVAESSTCAFVDVGGLFSDEGNRRVELTKSKQTCSGQNVSINQYGQKLDSERCSSEGDCSDCELIVGSPEKLREQWEKAYYRRRNNFRSVFTDFEDKAGSPKPSHPVHDNAKGANGGDRVDGSFHTYSDAMPSDEQSSPEVAEPSTSAFADVGGLFSNEGNTPVKLSEFKRCVSCNQYGRKLDSEGCSSESECSDCELMVGSSEELREQWKKASYRRRNNARSVFSDFEDKAGSPEPKYPFHDNSKEGIDVDPSSQQRNARNCSLHNDDDNVFDGSKKLYNGSKIPEQDNDPMETDDHFTSTCKHLDHENAEDTVENVTFTGPKSDVRNRYQHYDFDDFCFVFPQKFSVGVRVCEQYYDHLEMNGHATSTNDDGVTSGADQNKRNMTCAPECSGSHIDEQFIVKDTVFVDDFHEPAGKPAENFMCQQNSNAKMQDVESSHTDLFVRHKDAGIRPVPSDDASSCHGSAAAFSSDQVETIIDRQKIKETVEYKHAMEEELAARKLQLMREAEEARRLRNRKKAERMRIVMNKRRQKERVEEIRQTRRKDEENQNLKEKYRAEIKKELQRIEATSGDMASLLRCLGIHVGGGSFPSPHEVQAAYKRACLKFHPDRISATDLRQQVEAEETFKLISNMKDKFLSK